jgi:hypothetical protein
MGAPAILPGLVLAARDMFLSLISSAAFKPHGNGEKGDASMGFAFATFFPEIIQ